MNNQTELPILFLDNIHHGYGEGHTRVEVLRGSTLIVRAGEVVALKAPSGAGKSTLLHLAGLMERQEGGEIYIAGKPTNKMSDSKRSEYRRKNTGVIFQLHRLMMEFTATENVIIPQLINGSSMKDAKNRAESLLADVGLGHRLNHKPSALSGGERQRVALARAMANKPKLILADEPTGALGQEHAMEMVKILCRLKDQENTGLLIVTHDADIARMADRRCTLQDGRIINEK